MGILKKVSLTILFFGFSVYGVLGQESIKLKGIVYDSATKQPVEYVDIGIRGKGIGTVSDDSGRFSLNIPADKRNDSLTFSCIGYHTKKIRITDFLSKKENPVFLIQRIVQLTELKIVSKKLKNRTKGNKTRSKSIVLGISSSLNLGMEIGTVVKLPDKPVYIENFNFHIVYNRPDSAKFRLNIYSYDKKIGNNILNKDIYFTIHGKTTGDFKVNLTKYNIVVRGDVFVAVEVLADYSKGPDPNKKFDKYYYDRINISGSIIGSQSYSRKISLGKWENEGHSFSPGFWLTVAY